MELGLRAASATLCISQHTKKITVNARAAGTSALFQAAGRWDYWGPTARVVSVPPAAQTKGERLHAAQLPRLVSCFEPDVSVLSTIVTVGIAPDRLHGRRPQTLPGRATSPKPHPEAASQPALQGRQAQHGQPSQSLGSSSLDAVLDGISPSISAKITPIEEYSTSAKRRGRVELATRSPGTRRHSAPVGAGVLP